MVGAVLSLIIGYGLCAAITPLGWALFSVSSTAHRSAAVLLRVSSLDFYAIHHIRTVGSSADGSPAAIAVSILWPATIWAVLPAAAIVVGGYVAAKIARTAVAGAWVAFPYAAILLIVRPFVLVSSASVNLPAIPISGAEFDPGLLSVQLSPSFLSTLFHGLLFGGIFGAIGGAGGFGAIVRWIKGNSSWPAWARGGLLGLLISETVFLLLLTALLAMQAGRQDKPGQAVRTWGTEALAGAKFAHYLSQGVTIKGSVEPLQSGSFRIGWFTGLSQQGKPAKALPWWTFCLAIIPAGSLVYAGRSTARTGRNRTSKPMLIATTAGAYALFQSAAVVFYTIALRTAINIGGSMSQSALVVAPSASQAFLFGLIFSLIFITIGVSTYRPHADSQFDPSPR